MYPMLQRRLRAPVTVLITPICRALMKMGVRPNHLTIAGALGTTLSSLYFFGRGNLFVGTLIVTIFVLSDLLDGTLARMTSSSGTAWGALLDSTLDRLSDAAIILGIFIFLISQGERSQWLAIAVLVASSLVPYIRARAEGLGIECSVGIGERTERLIFLLVGTGLQGLGLTNAINASLWIVFLMSIVTIGQRMALVARSSR